MQPMLRGLIVSTLALIMLPSGAALADHQLSERAAIGGALGGALGAYLGAETGGREGAIIGGALGGGGGAAIATHGYRSQRYYAHPQPPRYSQPRYYAPTTRYYSAPRPGYRHPRYYKAPKVHKRPPHSYSRGPYYHDPRAPRHSYGGRNHCSPELARHGRC